MCHLKFLYYHDLVPYDTELVWTTEQKLVKLQSSKLMMYSRSIVPTVADLDTQLWHVSMLKMKRWMKITEINTMASEGDTTLTGSINETLSHQDSLPHHRLCPWYIGKKQRKCPPEGHGMAERELKRKANSKN